MRSESSEPLAGHLPFTDLRVRFFDKTADLRWHPGLLFPEATIQVSYLKDLLTRGDLGTPYIYNAYEQNSQWLSPQSPLRNADRVNSGRIQVASLEGYGAPVIDIGHWFMESDLTAVTARLGRYALIALGVLIVSFLAAHGVASRLHRTITGPVQHLAATADAEDPPRPEPTGPACPGHPRATSRAWRRPAAARSRPPRGATRPTRVPRAPRARGRARDPR